jgi:hypothetical protein
MVGSERPPRKQGEKDFTVDRRSDGVEDPDIVSVSAVGSKDVRICRGTPLQL